MTSAELPSDLPSELLAATKAAVQRTRLARRGSWFPLTLFGLITIAAAPWYAMNQPTSIPVPGVPGVSRILTPPRGLFGLDFSWLNDRAITVYWLVTLAVGYAATIAFYRYRSHRSGVTGRVLPFVWTGIAALALLICLSPTVASRIGLAWLPADLVLRDLTPMLVIAVGLFVLAYLERSPALVAFAAFFFVVALVSNLYDVENQSATIGWTPTWRWQMLPNLWLAGFTLLLGGLGFGLATALRSRRRTL
jgi:hypothetical protein